MVFSHSLGRTKESVQVRNSRHLAARTKSYKPHGNYRIQCNRTLFLQTEFIAFV